MRDVISLTKRDFVEIMQVLDKTVCILDMSDKRSDIDNRAYALAIACAEADLTAKLTRARKLLSSQLMEEELYELDRIGVFDYEIPQLPHDANLEELRERLRPYAINYRKNYGKLDE